MFRSHVILDSQTLKHHKHVTVWDLAGLTSGLSEHLSISRNSKNLPVTKLGLLGHHNFLIIDSIEELFVPRCSTHMILQLHALT